jgi:molybdenum cofactor biosynthesis enzyme MoaA
MSAIKVFNSTLNVRDFDCISKKPIKPHVNLYIKLTNRCNLNCPFCEYHGKDSDEKFDKYKLYYILNELKDTIEIRKVSITGGEPSLKLKDLVETLEMVKRFNKDIFTVVSTNGSELNELVKIKELIDSVSISCHIHIEDHFSTLTGSNRIPFVPAKLKQFMGYVGVNKVHLTCNLIKGYIDSPKAIDDYLEFYSDVGVLDFGFVSLMPANQFCKDHLVKLSDINFDSIDGVIKTKSGSNGNICSCSNYLKSTKSGNIIKFYIRHLLSPSCSESTLVFEGNELRASFGGPIILDSPLSRGY